MPSDRRPTRDSSTAAAGIVVPIRSFRLGKARLADAVRDSARTEIARELASRVLDATRGLATVVVSSDDEVVSWARTRDTEVLPDPGTLDGAADAGRRWALAHDFTYVVVVHADLPLARSLEPVVTALGTATCVLVPCHRDDGTPVLAVPTAAEFRFAYGPGSFRRHATEAERVGLEVCVVDDPTLRFDVDLADDLATWRARESRPA